MSRNSRKRENQRVKQRRLHNAVINSIIRSEPVIRVTDNRNRYRQRRVAQIRTRRKVIKREFERVNSPGRFKRKLFNETLRVTFGEENYKKYHNCKREWRKLLSWRAGQGVGRKRTNKELRNNYSTFIKKDC